MSTKNEKTRKIKHLHSNVYQLSNSKKAEPKSEIKPENKNEALIKRALEKKKSSSSVLKPQDLKNNKTYQDVEIVSFTPKKVKSK